MKLFDRKQETSESTLLERYRQMGDLDVLGALYQPLMDTVYLTCFKYLRDEDLSKDAVMQIFEQLIEPLRAQEVSNFRGWVHRVAVNHCLMYLRKQRVVFNVELDDDSDLVMPDEYDSSYDVRIEKLGDCLKALQVLQRRAVELFFRDEKCYREIASEMESDTGQVKSYIQNGKRNLKICMERHGRG